MMMMTHATLMWTADSSASKHINHICCLCRACGRLAWRHFTKTTMASLPPSRRRRSGSQRRVGTHHGWQWHFCRRWDWLPDLRGACYWRTKHIYPWAIRCGRQSQWNTVDVVVFTVTSKKPDWQPSARYPNAERSSETLFPGLQLPPTPKTSTWWFAVAV